MTFETGFLDKVRCYHEQGFLKNSLVERWKHYGFEFGKGRPREDRWSIEVVAYGRPIYIRWGNRSDTTYNFFLNPSKFKNVYQMQKILIEVLGEECLEAKVNRVDFTVDIPIAYHEVLAGLEVKYKRANVEFHNNYNRTGLNVGGNQDKFVIYNKSDEKNLPYPLTRIERQLRGRKIVFSKFGEIANSLDRILDFHPMKYVKTNYVQFLKGKPIGNKQNDRFYELRTLVLHEGLYLAKKKLSLNRNFHRDYEKFFRLIPCEQQPSDYFNKGIKKFYQGK
ncbi:MAG: hypothetical protein HQK52_09345 [Oligoflexia bacterium]|nr:hypothetical protein [Oligoflexia bacterium]